MKEKNTINNSAPLTIKKFFDSTQLGESIMQTCKDWTYALIHRRYSLCVIHQDVMTAYNTALRQFYGACLNFKRTCKGINFIECCLYIIIDGTQYPVAKFHCEMTGDVIVTWCEFPERAVL